MLVSVAGGKVHKMSGELDRSQVFRSASTACGLAIKPVNYFATDEDANSYTGGRLSAYLCKHCGTKGSPEHAK